MKKTLFLLPAALFVGCLTDIETSPGNDTIHGSGIACSEKRALSDYNRIQVDGAYRVAVKCGKDASLELGGDDNIVPLVITEVKNQTLHVYTKQGISPVLTLSITITIPDMSSVTLNGACRMDIDGIDNKKFDVTLNGSSEMTGSGKTDALTITITGASNVFTKSLTADAVSVCITGSGVAKVYAKKSLNVVISGSGVVMHGGGAMVTQHITGSGSVIADP